jgi:hypothetical protein
MTTDNKRGDSGNRGWAIALSRTVAGRASPRAAPRLVHSATIDYRGGPSRAFVALTRNPSLESPLRFEPTVKGCDDVVI